MAKKSESVTGDYLLRGIDLTLWRQMKAKAALEGLTIRVVIEEAIRMWLKSR